MVVVDASAIVRMLTDVRPQGAAARETAHRMGQWHVPDHLHLEVVAALRGRWLGQKLAESEFFAAVEDLSDMRLASAPTRDLVDRVVELRHDLTPYDAAYVALAEQLSCPLLTADGRLSRAPGIDCEVVVLEE